MEAMAMERFKAWKNEGLPVPDILYYGKGPSSDQYTTVISVELHAIQNAWKKVWPKHTESMRGTAIIVERQHHTRFFPQTDDAHNTTSNCKVGTLVDRGILSPYFLEFFLQSHHPLEGTVRPTRYFVLVHTLRLLDFELQRLASRIAR